MKSYLPPIKLSELKLQRYVSQTKKPHVSKAWRSSLGMSFQEMKSETPAPPLMGSSWLRVTSVTPTPIKLMPDNMYSFKMKRSQNTSSDIGDSLNSLSISGSSSMPQMSPMQPYKFIGERMTRLVKLA